MTKYKNCKVTINKGKHSGINTNGAVGVVDSWNSYIKKYKIIFDNGFCGWYKRSELIFNT